MKNKKILPLLGIILLLLTSGGLTYAFFQAQSSDAVTRDVHVLTHTVDTLTFSVDEDIEIEATQQNFTNGGNSLDGESNITAILTPNSKTGSATKSYYLYLNIAENDTVYSAANTNEQAEVLLQLFDSNDQLVTLTGLGNQVTVGTLTGYDITGITGVKTLLSNHTITASNNTATTEEWKVVITLINHNFNQNDNTGKQIRGSIAISESEMSFAFTGTIYRNNTTYAQANSSIIPENGTKWCDIETSSGNQYDCFDEQSECEQFLVDKGYTSTDTCEQVTGTFGGVGSYETNVNTIRTAVYSIYCPIGGDNLTCGNNWYYPTEQECLDDSRTSGYTCTAGSINKPYYLKHEVEDDIIESTETCLWYNNNEFCFGPNYWVGDAQDQVDGTTTRSKLQTAMEAALGTQADSCDSSSDYAYCDFGDFYCSANAYGFVECGDDSGYCGVFSDGSSDCDL